MSGNALQIRSSEVSQNVHKFVQECGIEDDEQRLGMLCIHEMSKIVPLPAQDGSWPDVLSHSSLNLMRPVCPKRPRTTNK